MKRYLELSNILQMHDELITRYGGVQGIRSPEGIKSALARPQCGYYSDIVEEGVSILESLLINHPFLDGNKRTAFAACDVFLRINGYRVHADSEWLYSKIVAWLTAKEDRFEAMVADLRVRIQKTLR